MDVQITLAGVAAALLLVGCSAPQAAETGQAAATLTPVPAASAAEAAAPAASSEPERLDGESFICSAFNLMLTGESVDMPTSTGMDAEMANQWGRFIGQMGKFAREQRPMLQAGIDQAADWERPAEQASMTGIDMLISNEKQYAAKLVSVSGTLSTSNIELLGAAVNAFSDAATQICPTLE